MSIEVKVPQLPESVADATLVAWHKKPGETVRRSENLVDLETDKVVLEVPAPVDGVLKQIVAADGAVVTSGQLLAVLEPLEAGATPAAEPEVAAAAAEPAAAAPRPVPAATPAAAPAAAAETGRQRAATRRRSCRSAPRSRATPPRRGARPTKWGQPFASSSRSTTSIPPRSRAPAVKAASRRATFSTTSPITKPPRSASITQCSAARACRRASRSRAAARRAPSSASR